MNRTITSAAIITGGALVFAAILALLQQEASFLLSFVNSMFYLALPCILAGGFLFLLERGFFNTTRYAFRKMMKVTQSKQEAMLEEEPRENEKELLYRTYSFRLTYPLLLTGFVLAALSMGISFAVLV